MSSIPDHLPAKPIRRRKKKGRHPQNQRQASWDSTDFCSSSCATNNTNNNNNSTSNNNSSTTDNDSHQLLTGMRLLTYDFVVRSLRRRLWKAFLEDDALTATRAYQATLPDFIRWLEEEHQEKRLRERQDAAKKKSQDLSKLRSRSISPARSIEKLSKHARRSSWDQSSWSASSHNRSIRKGRRLDRKIVEMENEVNYHLDNNNYRYELLKHQHQQRMETESMIGGPSISILQSLMNPSDPFIADDYLGPLDDSTYDHPARKNLPDPIQHAAEQRAIEAERKRRRKARRPRMAFRRMITGRRSDRPALVIDGPGGSHDFDLIDSIVMEAMNDRDYSPDMEENSPEEGDLSMTTPLHEAARVGSSDFVRFLLASGGDPNTKNGASQTAFHICAGGYTAEEQKLAEAEERAEAAEAEAALEGDAQAIGEGQVVPEKKKKRRYRRSSKNKSSSLLPSLSPSPSLSFDSTASITSAPGGIPPIVISNKSLELMRELDSDELEPTKDLKKSPATHKSRNKLFRNVFSLRHKKDKKDHNHSMEEDREHEFQTLSNPRKNRRRKTINTNPERFHELAMDRMESMVALLAFVHRESGEGPSINAVDHNGRTSLHYAAELGRMEVCKAMLAHFGIMLTIVDEMGTRTPCEVAADRNHTALTALLEARALLYIDPYGLDDEMMDMIIAANEGGNSNGNSTYNRNNPNGRIVPPYRWFITLTKGDVARERENLLDEAREKLMEAFHDTPCPREEEEGTEGTQESFVGSTRGYCSHTNKNTNLESYASTLVNEQPNLKSPPPFNNQEVSDGDQKPLASDDKEAMGNEDCYTKLPNLLESHLEQFMAHHNWDLSAALNACRHNRVEAFATAGMQNVFDEKKEEEHSEAGADECICPICYDDEVEKEDWMVLQNCGHSFCKDCLTDYLKEFASNRTPAHLVTCPDHNCNSGISKPDLQSLLEKDHPETLSCILDASADNFVASHTNFRFCPHPGCSGIVHRFRQPKWASADYDESILNYTGAVCTAVTPPMEKTGNECTLTYEGVEDLDYTNCRSLQQPKKAHRFCFSCGEGVHWPLTCERLAEWEQRISDEVGKVDENSGESNFNELAQKVWLKANTRPCPKCKIPIEKADGCNHMVCHNCHHEFCWICRQDWYLHSTDTGGFFRCNIWREDDADRILDKEEGDEEEGQMNATTNFFEGMVNDHGYGSSMHTARKAWKKKQEVKRFLDHYSHWEAHKDSNALEQKMADSVCTRLAPVVEAAIDFDGSPTFNFGGKGLSFIHNAFFELAECRLTLRHSYAFSFYRYPSSKSSIKSSSPPMSYLGNKRKEKLRFERLQSELETLTEQMSDIVARSHLRASQIQITYLTSGAAEKRLELNNFLFQIYREEKREAQRQKRRESEEKKTPPPSARYYATAQNNDQPQNRDTRTSSSQEMFNRLMQMRDHRYEQTVTPYVTAADLPSNGRDLSMQLMAQDQRLHAIGERLRGMEGLLRSQNRGVDDGIRTGNSDENENTNTNTQFVYYRNDVNDDDHDGDNDESNPLPPAQMWACSRCTFMNTGGSFCAMCEIPR